jgi:recombination protein RecA
MAKLKSLQDGLEEIRKLYGTASVFQATDNFKSNIQSISTGSFNLNDAIGVGGIPSGRLIMLSGVESSGKSALALSIIKEAQKDNGVGYYIDGEFTFDPDWTQRLGVDLDRIMISQTNNAKEVFELLVGKPKNNARKNAIPGILENDKILHSGLKVVVIDSIDSLQPPMEMDSEVGKANMALMARFLPPELRRLTPILSRTGVSVIAIMQARSVPGQMYGEALTVSGGRALKHAASLWIDLGVMWNSDITIDGTKDGEKIGHGIKAKIRKNKVAPPFKQADFTLFFQKGIDIRPEIPEQAVQTGVITKESERIYTYKSALGDFKWNGLSNVIDAIKDNKPLLNEIALKVKDAKKKENEARLADTSFKEAEDSEDEAPGSVIEAKDEEGSSKTVVNAADTEGSSERANGDLIDDETESSTEEKVKPQKSSDSKKENQDITSVEGSSLEEKSIKELQKVAQEMGIVVTYKMNNKRSLIEAIQSKNQSKEVSK